MVDGLGKIQVMWQAQGHGGEKSGGIKGVRILSLCHIYIFIFVGRGSKVIQCHVFWEQYMHHSNATGAQAVSSCGLKSSLKPSKDITPYCASSQNPLIGIKII